MPSPRVLEEKRKIIEKIVDYAEKYKLIGIVDFYGLPARQLQDMREKLREKATIIMTKKTLMKRALEEIEKKGKENVTKLLDHLDGQPAFIFTNENPFRLFKLLKENQSPAPIKPGQVAPEDIYVRAGKTNFTPGPIIGELGAFKIKTGVEGGKVVIKEDVCVAKKGEVVNEKLANILQRLGIEPMKIGLKLLAIWEDKIIYTPEILDVSTEEILKQIEENARASFILAVEISYLCKETIQPLIIKAHNDALLLALEREILTKDTLDKILAKAHAQALALQETIKQ